MQKSAHILICDDQPIIHESLGVYLESEGFTHASAFNGVQAVKMAESEAPDLILMDLMMPEKSGMDACREIRQKSSVPIIMLTAKTDERDELQGFSLGVDEYIAKPFSPKILVARVEAVLRRSSAISDEQRLNAGAIVVDKAAHIVSIDGKEVDLSYKEFELLTYFMDNRGIALSREVILNHVWNYDYFGDARTIDTHVKKLRSKMGDQGNYIKTIWGMGYKFEVEE